MSTPRRPRALAPRLVCALLAATSLALPAVALGAGTPAPLTLAEAIALARAGSETPAVAAARIEHAEAVRRQAISALVPSLTLSGTYTRRAREVTRTVDDETVTVQALDALSGQAVVETTLFDLRALPLIRSASRSLEAQRLESAELERALAFDVADTFYAVLSAERLRDAAERRVRVAEATVEEARLRLEAGLANRNDLTRADLERATARLEATRSAQDVESARLALAFLIASPVDRPLAEPEPLPAVAEERAALVSRAQSARRELAALAERAEAARQSALAPRLGLVPTLDLRGLYRTTNEAGLSGNDEDWNVGVTLTWELFDGGAREALADQRLAEAREADLALAVERRRVALEVEQAATVLASADAALSQAETRLEAARQNAEEVRERYRAGLASALEQADAQVSEFEAEAELARQGFLRAVARLALERATGGEPLAASPTPEISTP